MAKFVTRHRSSMKLVMEYRPWAASLTYISGRTMSEKFSVGGKLTFILFFFMKIISPFSNVVSLFTKYSY